MPEPLARHEDRAADVEAEGVVLEGCAVPVPHQEPDQAGVGVVQLGLPPREADAGAVDDREVVGHRAVEAHEAVVEDLDRVLRYHLLSDCHSHSGECNEGICRRLRLLLPRVAGFVLPGRREAARVPRALRAAPERGRAEQHLLPPAGRGAVRALGGGDAARLPVLDQGTEVDLVLRPARSGGDARRAAVRARPAAGPDPRPRPRRAAAGRRLPGAAARLPRSLLPRRARPAPPVVGRRRGRAPGTTPSA